MADCIFGVDLGHKGGIACVPVGVIGEPVGKPHAWRMPVIPAPKGKGRVYDLPEINDRLHAWAPDHVFIEESQLKGKPIKTTLQPVASLARCQAIFETICCVRNYPCTIVPARTWQRTMFAGLGKVQDTKAASVLVAKRLFPGVDLRPGQCRKDQDGLADALLLAEYGRRQLKGHNDEQT